MIVRLLAAPYDLGVEGVGVGGAPDALRRAGLADALRADGHEVEWIVIGRPDAGRDELGKITQIAASLAEELRRALAAGAFPVVVGGNCNLALGVLAGLGPATTGVIWFDAHGDFNTPDTSPSGYLDGMPLAIACGRCEPQVWTELGAQPLPEEHVVHVGGRDFDPEERRALLGSRVSVLSAQRLRRGDVPPLWPPTVAEAAGQDDRRPRPRLERRGPDKLYIHLDIDVLDPTLTPATDYAAPGGLDTESVLEVVRTAAAELQLSALTVASYNPSLPDPERRTEKAVLEMTRAIVDIAARQRR